MLSTSLEYHEPTLEKMRNWYASRGVSENAERSAQKNGKPFSASLYQMEECRTHRTLQALLPTESDILFTKGSAPCTVIEGISI